MKTYYCAECDAEFEAEGKKVEGKDALYGNVWWYQANCNECDTLCKETKKPLSSSNSTGSDRLANNPSCATGACPFVN